MPRLLHSAPKYRLHRASGRAVVTLNGKDHYVGPWKSTASKIEYDRLIGEWMANGRQASAASGLTIVELIAAYWKFVQSYYVRDGQPTGGPERTLVIMDLFGEDKLGIGWTIDTPFQPGESQVQEGMGLDYNQFMDHHRWFNSTDLKDMTFRFDLKSIIYADGTRQDF